MLYFWTKYFKKNVSILINNRIENWSSQKTTNGDDDKVFLEKAWEMPCIKSKCIPKEYLLPTSYDFGNGYEEVLNAPYDFAHMGGQQKAWSKDVQASLNLDDILDRFAKHGVGGLGSPQEYWYVIFHRVHERLGMNNVTGDDQEVVDIRNLNVTGAKLGYWPNHADVNAVIEARTGNSTSHVESWEDYEKRIAQELDLQWTG